MSEQAWPDEAEEEAIYKNQCMTWTKRTQRGNAVPVRWAWLSSTSASICRVARDVGFSMEDSVPRVRFQPSLKSVTQWNSVQRTRVMNPKLSRWRSSGLNNFNVRLKCERKMVLSVERRPHSYRGACEARRFKCGIRPGSHTVRIVQYDRGDFSW